MYVTRQENAFFITFKGLLLKQIKNYFLKGESPTLNSNITSPFILN